MKTTNEYSDSLGKLFKKMPKAVLAAVAVSSVTCGGDYIDKGKARVLKEWWVLYRAGIVSQRPTMQEPQDEE